MLRRLKGQLRNQKKIGNETFDLYTISFEQLFDL